MNILVLNAGSSSIKFALFSSNKRVLHGAIKGIATKKGLLTYTLKETVEQEHQFPDHETGLQCVIDTLLSLDLHHVDAVGHRVVHGGVLFTKPTVMSSALLSRLEQYNALAPLHNPTNISGIRIAMSLFDHVPHVAIFDTAFHNTIPEHITRIALSDEFTHNGLVRKYGFHGTSHQYVAEKLGNKGKLLSAHIGNGISVSAIVDGKSVNNSMGFTPLRGPIMGTRVGDIDFGVAKYLHDNNDLDIDEIDFLFNHHGGLDGITGESDIKEVHDRIIAHDHSKPYDVAMDKLVSDIARLLAGFCADMGGADMLAFTGGAGEAAPWLREAICTKLSFLGFVVDSEKNSRPIAKVTTVGENIYVVPTDEELMIAKLTAQTIQR